VSDGEGSQQTQAPPEGDKPVEEMTVGELVFEVSDRASVLVREEIELAKTEVTEKATELIKGSVVGIAAGVFVLVALAMLMHAVAWGINDLLDIETAVWVGFLIEALVWLVVATFAGMLAYRAVRKGAPPKPAMAIEEAKQTKETLGGNS
jgi:cobalamin biosynthesis protein CobD/CbiB